MNERRTGRTGLYIAGTLCLTLAAYGGCSSDSDATTSGTNTGGASSGTNSGGQGGDIFTGGTNSGGQGGDDSCASVSEEATLASRPVDIIVAIDNSGSMGGEISEVEVQMTKNFAAILDAAVPPIDYRVILVARHGQNGAESVCIAEPLGTVPDANDDGHCDTVPQQPTDNPPKFFHHSVEISSHNALCRLRQQFDVADEWNLHPNGYKELLRDDSYKFFLVITDDRPSSSQQDGCTMIYDDGNDAGTAVTMAAQWDADMQALSPEHFGADAESRNYTFWSVVSLAPYMGSAADKYGEPHPPDVALAPITTAECSPGAQNPGVGYQALSVLTGGYRYPTCAADDTPPGDYEKLFTLMAQGVIEGAQVGCEFLIPEPPAGQTPDLNTLEVDYESDGMLVSTFTQVPGLAECDDTSFYIEDDTIILCPGACATVQSDENAKLTVSYDCGAPPT